MANKRMFSLKIVDTDIFLDMPLSAQNLYFHLNMRADDDGFIANHKKIMRMIGSNDDDMKILLAKDFIIPFESGVCVIKHWKIHNYIAKDRYHETIYIEEKGELEEHKNGMYTKCIQVVNKVNTQSRLDKIRLDKINTNNKPIKKKYGEYKNILLTDEEYEKLKTKTDNREEWIKTLDEGIELKGYKYKSHYLAILKWYAREGEKKEIKNTPFHTILSENEGINNLVKRVYNE